jgi:hypothetical protein
VRALLSVAIAVVVLAVVAVAASAALDWPSKSAETTTVVDAPRETVWRVVVDFDEYPAWNPYLRSVAGQPEEGGTLDVHLDPPGGDGQDVSASVTVYRPPRKLQWRSRLLVPGLRDLEYEVIVEPLGQGRAQVVQRARYEGVLSVLSDAEETRAGLQQMSRALKARAESGA